MIEKECHNCGLDVQSPDLNEAMPQELYVPGMHDISTLQDCNGVIHSIDWN